MCSIDQETDERDVNPRRGYQDERLDDPLKLAERREPVGERAGVGEETHLSGATGVPRTAENATQEAASICGYHP
jgi:hypothetical protein